MNQSLWISKTGLDAQQTKMSTIANNLANVGTTGFKRGRAIFEDLIYQNVRQVGSQSSQDTLLPSGLQVGTGTRVVATEKLFTQGNLTKTDNALDIAIQGRGFFEILLPDGTQGFTRDGSFQINDQGIVVTSAGYQLQPPITLPQDAHFHHDRRGRHGLGAAAGVRRPRRRSAACSCRTSSILRACRRAARTCFSSPAPAVRRSRATRA
jgi:flagellar basal-body rod protein FlgG